MIELLVVLSLIILGGLIWVFCSRPAHDPSPAAIKLALIFREGPIENHRLESLDICWMEVLHREHRILISWYPSGNLRSLQMDEQGFVGSREDAEYILEAAQSRAAQIMRERLAAVEKDLS